MGGKILLVTHNVNGLLRLLLFALLAESAIGFGQQALAAKPIQVDEQVLAEFVAQAQQAQASGDYRRAAEDYRKAVEMSPETPELWANLGLMQHETGDTSAAIRSFGEANRRNPSLYVPNLFLGVDYAHSGQPMKAIPFLIRAEKMNKTDPQAPLALGRAYVSAGRFTAAAQELERAIALDPKLGPAWFTVGIARLDQVEVDARTMSEEARTSPFSGDLYAESLEKQSRFGEAITLYKSLLGTLPQPPCIRSELGFAMIREHNAQGASDAFASERSIHPGCALAMLGEARLAIDKGDNDRAFQTLSELWNRDHGYLSANASALLEGMPQPESTTFVNQIAAADTTELPTAARDAMLAAFNQSGCRNTRCFARRAPCRIASSHAGSHRRRILRGGAVRIVRDEDRVATQTAQRRAVSPDGCLRIFHRGQPRRIRRCNRTPHSRTAFARSALLVDSGKRAPRLPISCSLPAA